MKRKMIYTLVITILALMLLAASSPKERVGDRLIIPEGTGTMYYYESVPFHLAHGWFSEIGKPAQTTALGETRLEIDGVTTPHDFIEFSKAEIDGTEYLLKEFVFNFPDGMTDTHIFDLYYSNVCDFWLAYGKVPECDNPNEMLEYSLRTWEVIFYEPIFVVYTPGSVEGYGWPLGKTITMNVNDGDYIAQSVSEQRPDFPQGETRVAFENWRDGYMIEPGDYVVLTDESTGVTKSHIVTSVEVTGYDLITKTVSGIYDPAFDLEVFLALEDGTPIETLGVAYDGDNWTATFEDLAPRMLFVAKQNDADFDATSWDYWIPEP